MASTNQSPAYQKAQGKFLSAKTDKERIEFLEEMIKECPHHKSSENMLANLKTRYKKLKEKIEKSKKSGKSSKIGIKKEDMQAVLIGFTNTGKSSLLSILTNAHAKIANPDFTTTHPIIGVMDYVGTSIQIIEIPAIESESYDKGLVNTADTILILITKLEQINKILEKLTKVNKEKIIILNKIDLLTNNEKRKISATLTSKKHNFVLISTKTKEGIDELKNKIFKSFNKIRVYTKEPGKEKSNKPIILEPNSTVKDVAEKILKGLSKKVKESKIWGPSSKFGGQKVGLQHKLKDLDVVEFKTR
tara:strand:- start:11588 stop:12499 length:912 start_codon:yes stop_codon:yes gene_type:complete